MVEFQPYDVSIPYAGLAERFEQWVREQGWVLSDVVRIEGSDRPMRFVQPSFGPPPVPKQVEPNRSRRCSRCGWSLDDHGAECHPLNYEKQGVPPSGWD